MFFARMSISTFFKLPSENCSRKFSNEDFLGISTQGFRSRILSVIHPRIPPRIPSEDFSKNSMREAFRNSIRDFFHPPWISFENSSKILSEISYNNHIWGLLQKFHFENSSGDFVQEVFQEFDSSIPARISIFSKNSARKFLHKLHSEIHPKYSAATSSENSSKSSFHAGIPPDITNEKFSVIPSMKFARTFCRILGRNLWRVLGRSFWMILVKNS